MPRTTCLLWLLLTASCLAQEPVSLYSGRLTFALPAGLYSIDPKVIRDEHLASAVRQGYLGTAVPQHVFRNPTGDVAIAFNHMSGKPAEADLEGLRDRLARGLKQKWPELEWLGSSIVVLNGVRWFELEFKSKDQAYVIHHWYLGTLFEGRLLAVAFSAFDDFDPAMTQALLQARLSLSLKLAP